MATWYKILLIVWLLTVVPVVLLAYGFSGGHLAFPRVSDFDFQEWLFFIVTSAWTLSPILLAPFGLGSRNRGRPGI